MQVHPSQISPAEPFDIFYFLRNHTDGATYYVRGVVYDVRTGEVLRTVDLDQSPTNARLFIKTVQAPPDPIGIGRNIVAIATVYTDASYTEKSQNYEEQEQYFLVRSAREVLGGGMVDYRAIQGGVEDALERAVAKIPKAEKVKLPDMPFAALSDALSAVQRDVRRIPKQQPDVAAALKPLEDRLEALSEQIATLPPPDTAPLDRSEAAVTEAVRDFQRQAQQALRAFAVQHDRAMQRYAETAMEKLEAALRDLMGRQELTIPLASLIKRGEEKPAQQPDLSQFYNQ